MCRIRTCCCCLNLRQGCYLAVVYSLLMGGIGVFYTVMMMQHVDSTYDHLQAQLASLGSSEVNSGRQTLKIILYITLGLYAAWILTALFIVCGIKSGVRGFLLPWIVITAVIMGLSAYSVGTNLMHILTVIENWYQLARFVTEVFIFLCSIYAVICVAAFYRNNLQLEEDEDIPEAVPMKGDAYYGPDAV